MNSVGIKTSINRKEFLSRAFANSISEQQVSHETIIEGVNMLQVGASAIVDTNYGTISCNIQNFDIFKLFITLSEQPSYFSLLQRAYKEISGVINALLELEYSRLSFDISGGLDSRTCFSFCSNKPKFKNIYCGSAIANKVDYSIAEKIAEQSQFSLNTEKINTIKRSKKSLYTLFNLGIYDSFYTINGWQEDGISRFKIGGHGAETFKGNYAWKNLYAIRKYIKYPNYIKDAFYKQSIKK